MITKDPLPDWSEPPSYSEWGGKWSPPIDHAWLAHLSENIHPDEVMAVARLLFPRFIEHDDCVFLEINFNSESYSKWKKELEEPHRIEQMINHLHIYDLFPSGVDIEDTSFISVAELLGTTWAWALKMSYPERNYKVEVLEEGESYGPVITFMRDECKTSL